MKEFTFYVHLSNIKEATDQPTIKITADNAEEAVQEFKRRCELGFIRIEDNLYPATRIMSVHFRENVTPTP